jgi:hypothetical protein
MATATQTNSKKPNAQKSSAKSGAKIVAGVAMAKVDEDLVRKALIGTGADPKVVAKMPIEGVVEDLQDHNNANVPEEERAACDECGGVSSIALDACPFCGESDDGSAAEEDDEAKALAGDEVEEDEEEEAPESEEKPKAKVETAKTSKPPKDALVKTDKNKKKPESIMVAVKPEVLDEAVAKVNELKSDAMGGYWKLGNAIRDIFDRQLWKARLNPDAKSPGDTPLYKNWQQFCDAELKMSPTNAYNLMDVSKLYTEKDVREIGVKKLSLILKASDPEEREKLKEQARTSSTREIQQRVESSKGRTRRKTGRKETPAGKPGAAGAKAAAAAGGKITVASLIGKTQTVKLYVKPEKGKPFDKPAKKLADNPVGFLELENKVRIYVALSTNAAGELVLQTKAKRASE